MQLQTYRHAYTFYMSHTLWLYGILKCILKYSNIFEIFNSTEETSNDEEDEEEWEVGAPREVIETNIYDRSEGPERHRQFDMKQLLTEQDEDTIGEYLKKKYADSHERRFVYTLGLERSLWIFWRLSNLWRVKMFFKGS